MLILDEPTTGLDPLMRSRFIELLLEEKDMGRTIFLSSHIFEEMEKTCDRVGMLVGGHLAAVETVPDGKEQRLEDIFMHYYGGEEHA